MLPWRVVLSNLLTGLREDAAYRNRLLGFALALVLLVGAFTAGFELEIRFGGGRDAAAPVGLETGAATQPRATAGPQAPVVAAGATATGTAGVSEDSGDQTSSPAPEAEAGDPCAGAALRATDQGVSEDTVKIGVLEGKLGPLAEIGFDVGVEVHVPAIMDAWANELNSRGGVACRQLTYVIEPFDVLSVDSMIAACRRMTQDHQVFATITAGGYDSVAQLCISRDNQTPLVNTEPQPASWYADAAPYLWSTLMSKDRMHRNHVRWMVESGEVSRSDRVGVVYHGIPNVGPAVEAAMLPELRRLGIDPVRVTKLSADDEQALAQISQVVVDFQLQQINKVFMPMNLIFKTQFMQQAEGQNYFPDYSDSDHYFGCFDFVTTTYPGQSWDGTPCVSSSQVAGMRPAELEELADNHPFQQYADEVYLRTHPDGYTHGGELDEEEANAQRAFQSVFGTLTLLVAEAANRVGPELTRAQWGVEMGNTGSFDKHTAPHPLSFGPQKWDGPDHLTVSRWRAPAGDGWESRSYRMVQPPFQAYY